MENSELDRRKRRLLQLQEERHRLECNLRDVKNLIKDEEQIVAMMEKSTPDR